MNRTETAQIYMGFRDLDRKYTWVFVRFAQIYMGFRDIWGQKPRELSKYLNINDSSARPSGGADMKRRKEK